MATAAIENGESKPLRVLFVEDSKTDADFLAFLLKNGGFALVHERVDTAEALEQALKNTTWDVVISDYKMPDFSGRKALELVRKMNPDIPFVVVSGAVGEEAAVELMKAGANDFISKTNLSRLVPAIERELRDVRDRRERKRAEEALRESEEKYRVLVENLNEGIWQIDKDGNTTFVNSRMARMLGYSAEEMIGKHLFLFMDKQGWIAAERKLERRRQGVHEQHDFEFLKKDGSRLRTSLETGPIFDEHGGYAGSVAGVQDITARKRTEEKIRLLSRELLTVREEEKKRVSSILHHDVGSLAVGLSAYFDAIEKDVRSGKSREALKLMKRIRKLVGQSVARLKHVAVELRPPELDLLGLSTALRHHFVHITERGGIRIHFTETLGRRLVPNNVATVVFRIVQEALTNAIKHGHAKKVDVKLSASKKELSLKVCNNGKGFHAAPRGGQRSAHLGLHMMEEMATSVGGVLTVDSTQGKTTTVSAVLPLKAVNLGGGGAARK